jgi:hypothetical protein
VAVLAVEQLSRHCRQPPSGVLGAGDVLCVGGVQCLHHLDAEVVMLADEVGGNLLGGAAEEGLREVLGGRGGYRGGFFEEVLSDADGLLTIS